MTPEQGSEKESAQLQKTAKDLEEKVDRLETAEVKNTPDDWSEEVRLAVQYGEGRIQRQVKELAAYLDNPDQFLAEKLKAYRVGVEEITKNLSKQSDGFNLREMTASLYRGSVGLPPGLVQMEKTAEAKQIATERPQYFVLDFDEYSQLPEAEDLLKEAVHKCVDSDNKEILFNEYELLHTRPFFKEEVQRAFQKLKDRGNPAELLAWISGMGEKQPEFIHETNVQEIVPKIFVEALLENPYLLIPETYRLYESEPWFEENLKTAWIKICASKPVEALKALFRLEKIPGFIEKPYVKEQLPSLLKAVIKAEPLQAIFYCDFYKKFYAEKEWDLLLRKDVIPALGQDDLQRVMLGIDTHKNNLPGEALSDLMGKASLMASEEVMEYYYKYKDIPNSQEYFMKAAEILKTHKPGVVLRLLFGGYQSDAFPFTDRQEFISSTAYWAAYIDPVNAVIYAEIYKDLPWGPQILERAQKKALIVQGLERTAFPSREEATMGLLLDHGLYLIDTIDRTWLPPELSDQEFAEAAAMISRNVFLEDNPDSKRILYREATEERVKSEYKKILETREKYKDFPLFKDRNIVLASHMEKWPSGEDRFGKEPLKKAMQDQQGEGCEFDHYEAKENTLEALKETKRAILEKIKTMPSPMTFVFDGHGGPDALYLSDGQVEGLETASAQRILETEITVKITVEEFSDTLAERSKLIGKDKMVQDILIFSSCYNHTFLRSMYDRLETAGAGKPITFGESEYNQVGYSKEDSPYGGAIFDGLLKDGTTTLEDVWQLPYDEKMNPSLYIPSNNTPQQVAENEIDAGESRAA